MKTTQSCFNFNLNQYFSTYFWIRSSFREVSRLISIAVLSNSMILLLQDITEEKGVKNLVSWQITCSKINLYQFHLTTSANNFLIPCSSIHVTPGAHNEWCQPMKIPLKLAPRCLAKSWELYPVFNCIEWQWILFLVLVTTPQKMARQKN